MRVHSYMKIKCLTVDFAARKLGLEKLKSQQVTALLIYLSIYPPGLELMLGIPTCTNIAAVGQKDVVPVDCLSTVMLRIEMVGTVFKILNYIFGKMTGA